MPGRCADVRRETRLPGRHPRRHPARRRRRHVARLERRGPPLDPGGRRELDERHDALPLGAGTRAGPGGEPGHRRRPPPDADRRMGRLPLGAARGPRSGARPGRRGGRPVVERRGSRRPRKPRRGGSGGPRTDPSRPHDGLRADPPGLPHGHAVRHDGLPRALHRGRDRRGHPAHVPRRPQRDPRSPVRSPRDGTPHRGSAARPNSANGSGTAACPSSTTSTT